MAVNNTAIIYPRVSTSKQDNNWDSLNRQKKECLKYCKYNGLKIQKTFIEVFTWKVSERPKLNEAIEYAIKNKIWYFVIFDIDRFSREWYEAYSKLKKTLTNHWIKLKDTKNIIWDTHIVYKNEIFDTSQYKWNIENPTEMSEMVISAYAKLEWNKIIQRTIPKEIELEQKWYHVRSPNFWYKLKRVSYNNWLAKIQIKDDKEWIWIEEIFKQRANWVLSDQEIIDKVNLMWYKSRRWKQLNIKQLQVYIKMPVYAGVISSKWTWYKPIYTAYEWLIPINIWNKANKWKIKILEKSNWKLQILHWEKEVTEPIIKTRKKFDERLPFRNLIKSSLRKDKYISWSVSKNSKWQLFPYYHPIREKWKNSENIKKEEFENNIYSLLEEIKIDNTMNILFNDVFDELFDENKRDLAKDKIILENRLKEIKSNINKEENKMDSVIGYPRLLKKINDNLEILDEEKIKIKEEIRNFNKMKYDNLDRFKEFCFYILAQLDNLVKNSQNMEELQLIFKFIFKEVPHYQQIINRTLPLRPILAFQSQQKNPQNEDFNTNLKWQPH